MDPPSLTAARCYGAASTSARVSESKVLATSMSAAAHFQPYVALDLPSLGGELSLEDVPRRYRQQQRQSVKGWSKSVTGSGRSAPTIRPKGG